MSGNARARPRITHLAFPAEGVERTESVPPGETLRVRVEHQSRGIVDAHVWIDREPARMLTLEALALEELRVAPGKITWRWLVSAGMECSDRGGESHTRVRN